LQLHVHTVRQQHLIVLKIVCIQSFAYP